jgi:hypothetical protein
MADFHAPDGSNQPINTQTVQYLNHFPAYAIGYLSGVGSANWEQAAIVYINGQRQATQMGTFNRPAIFWLPQSTQPQQIMLAGWHKRGAPSGSLPWVASRGMSDGQKASWDDSGGDLDFNDYKVTVVKLPGPRPLMSHLAGDFTQSRQPADVEYVALAVVLLEAVSQSTAALPAGRAATAIQQHIQNARSRLLADYRAQLEEQRQFSRLLEEHRAHAEKQPSAVDEIPDRVQLTTQVRLFAHNLLEASARADLLGNLDVLLRECDSPASTANG